MNDNNDPIIKKSSIRIFRDMIEKPFQAKHAEVDAKGKELSEAFHQRVQRFAPQLKELVVIEGEVPMPSWGGDRNPPSISVYVPNTEEAKACYPEGLKQEIVAAMDARQILNRQKAAVYEAQKEAHVHGDRSEIVEGLLRTRPEGLALLRQVEELALKIADEELKKLL